MSKFEIVTPYGDRYIIHENGDIQRMDQPDFVPSGEWKMVGIEAVNSPSVFVRIDHLAEFLADNPPLLYKNGNPRYTVRDCDHGSFRTWGNTKYHGIKSIRKLAA